MNHELLKNNVYLTLLAFYDNKEMPKYVELGKAAGVTRQTAAKRVKELTDSGVIQIVDDILLVENDMELDVGILRDLLTKNPNITAIELESIFFGGDNKYKIMKDLDMSYGCYYAQLHEKSVVYGIVSEGIVKYVGCTKNYEERIKQHIRKRPFLDRSNFIILKEIDSNDRYQYERQLIDIIDPEWNTI